MTSPDVEVRWLASGDEGLAAEAVRHVLRDDPLGIEAGWLIRPGVHLAVALLEGVSVGVAYGHTLPLPDGRAELLLYSLDVAGSHRRRGIGRALVQAFVDRARSLGFDEVWVLTEPGNEAANATYRSVGPPSERHESVMYVWSTTARKV